MLKSGDKRRETYVLDQSALVLEGVTLAQVVELVVEVLVNLARGTVLDEEAAEDTLAAHPKDLAKGRKRHTHISRRFSTEHPDDRAQD